MHTKGFYRERKRRNRATFGLAVRQYRRPQPRIILKAQTERQLVAERVRVMAIAEEYGS